MTSFTIATWNVNSLRVRLAHLADWINLAKPDVIALQETKLIDADFPLSALAELGYSAVFSGQKTYNGMAILSKQKIHDTDVITDVPGLIDPQRRILCASIGDVRVVNLYVPNGQSVGSEKYQYKLSWLAKIKEFLAAELQKYPKLVVVGDFNIAPDAIDVHDPEQWEGKILCSDAERAAFADILSLGFVDIYRMLYPNEKMFTWWDYRLYAFKRNLGLRIDHILMSQALLSTCSNCTIDKTPRQWERPSDHAPVFAEIKI